jgi:hypothetical protein
VQVALDVDQDGTKAGHRRAQIGADEDDADSGKYAARRGGNGRSG